jgi:hypothetical protein
MQVIFLLSLCMDKEGTGHIRKAVLYAKSYSSKSSQQQQYTMTTQKGLSAVAIALHPPLLAHRSE